jgi:hypothetical protein
MAAPRYAVERKHSRYSLDARAKLCAGTTEITVRTVDVSVGGVGVLSPVEIADGSSFVIEFVFPTMQDVFRAEVVTQSKCGFRYGFRFVQVDEKNMALLHKYERRWGIRVSTVGA